MRLPPDRGHLTTEQRHPGSSDLDAWSIEAMVGLMIDDQHAALAALRGAATDLARFIEALVPRLRAGGRLIYIGAGTSGRLGVLDASECPPTFNADPGQIVGVIAGGDASLRRSSESREDEPEGAREQLAELRLTPLDTVMGIAAGGTTPYVLGALRLAKEMTADWGSAARAATVSPRAGGTHALPGIAGGDACATTGGDACATTGGDACATTGGDACATAGGTPAPRGADAAMTGLLTCVPREAPESCDHLIVLDTGPELLTGSTRLKAGTATKIALNIITTSCFVQLGKTWGNLMVDLRATNDKLRDRAMRILIEAAPRLSRAQAAAALDAAGGELKTALVMSRLGVGPDDARRLLAERRGQLREVLR